MKKEKIQRSKLFIVVMILSIAVMLTMPSLFAKYKNDKEEKGDVVLEDFAVELVPKIEGQKIELETVDSPIATDGTITLSVADYEKFTLDLEYEGDGKSYIRVLIEESWIYDSGTTQTVLINSSGATTFAYDTNIVQEGNYFYVNGIVPNIIISPNLDGIIIPIITGVTPPTSLPTTNIGSNQATHVKLSIKVEAVQYNRVNAKWGSETPVTKTTP